jgi:pyruvate formate lyase activating enzyme
LIGRHVSVEQTVRAALADKVFYKETGGVTLSGGEPLVQIGFAEAVLRGCKEQKLHTAVETSGCVDWRNISRVLPYTDLFLYDIKLMDAKKHLEFTGGDNGKILHNAQSIARQGVPLVVRVPVIPGINDDEENLMATVHFARRIGAKSVDLLPYHRLGEPKYAYLGKKYSLSGAPVPDVGDFLPKFADMGIPVTLCG